MSTTVSGTGTQNWLDVTSGKASTATSSSSTTTTSGVDSLANENTFLQLMVAQLRNQNPLNPTDGVQFLSQLAQMSSLEQNLHTNDTLNSILSTLNSRLPAPTGTTTNTGN